MYGCLFLYQTIKHPVSLYYFCFLTYIHTVYTIYKVFNRNNNGYSVEILNRRNNKDRLMIYPWGFNDPKFRCGGDIKMLGVI